MTLFRQLPAAARRRLSDEPAHRVTADRLVQPIDVDLALPEEGREAVEALPGWYSYGCAAAIERMHEGRRQGITEFVLRISDVHSVSSPTRLDAHAAAVSRLVQAMPADTRCTVDPFALALNPDGSWGLRGQAGDLDVPSTYALVQDAAAVVASSGAHGIITLGRLPHEVEHTRAGITSVNGGTRLYSFSQNTETSTAYAYLPAGHRDTGQKILTGNLREMTLWALLDAFHGTDVSVTKPLENLHVTLDLVRHMEHQVLLDDLFKALSGPTAWALPEDIAQMLAALQEDQTMLLRRLSRLELYGYTVSGSTRALAHLAASDGIALARARLEESWTNWLAAADRPDSKIIDRNAMSYLAGGLLGGTAE